MDFSSEEKKGTDSKEERDIELLPLTGSKKGGSSGGNKYQGRYYTSADKIAIRNKYSLRFLMVTYCKCVYFVIVSFVSMICLFLFVSGVIVGLIFLIKFFIILSNRQFMKGRRTVIVLSVDSFRYDYFQLYPSSYPNIKSYVIENGIRLDRLQPVYPTKTFPNHYSIATGLFPVHNGLVSNTMYDPVFNSVYSMSDPVSSLNSSWYAGEPIWVTCEKQKTITNVFFWPGSEVKIEGYYPSVYLKYDQSLPYKDRMDYILNALKKKRKERPHLIMGYFEGVDTAAHTYGPGSKEVEDEIIRVDDAIGLLVEGMKNQRIEDLVDIIIVSDHGMASVSNSKRINIDTIIDVDLVDMYNYGPFVDIWVKDKNNTQQIYNTLKSHSILTERSSVYLKEEIPKRFDLYNGTYSRRISDIWIKANDGWSVTLSSYGFNVFGSHGFDNEDEHMQGILIARGPHIKDTGGEIIEGFENIHVYPLLAELLQVTPETVDGSLEVSGVLLK